MGETHGPVDITIQRRWIGCVQPSMIIGTARKNHLVINKGAFVKHPVTSFTPESVPPPYVFVTESIFIASIRPNSCPFSQQLVMTTRVVVLCK